MQQALRNNLQQILNKQTFHIVKYIFHNNRSANTDAKVVAIDATRQDLPWQAAPPKTHNPY
jgi:hypothetical protein